MCHGRVRVHKTHAHAHEQAFAPCSAQLRPASWHRPPTTLAALHLDPPQPHPPTRAVQPRVQPPVPSRQVSSSVNLQPWLPRLVLVEAGGALASTCGRQEACQRFSALMVSAESCSMACAGGQIRWKVCPMRSAVSQCSTAVRYRTAGRPGQQFLPHSRLCD